MHNFGIELNQLTLDAKEACFSRRDLFTDMKI